MRPPGPVPATDGQVDRELGCDPTGVGRRDDAPARIAGGDRGRRRRCSGFGGRARSGRADSGARCGWCGLGCGGRSARRRLFALAEQPADDLARFEGLADRSDGEHHAGGVGFDLGLDLVGRDHHDDVAGVHRGAGRRDPLGDGALGHGQTELRHQDLGSHGMSPREGSVTALP